MRLLGYIRPYSLQFFASVMLMAAVGALHAFRLLLIGPVLRGVLNPSARTDTIPLGVHLPWGTHKEIDLHQFMPGFAHNVLTVVALALVGATIMKGICDYLGTYLVNYAGYGLTTDLRNSLYKKILARSISFFSRYPTGTLISTVVNDIEKVQFALSTVMAEFLQQFFTFLFLTVVVIWTGHKLAWILLLFIPFIVFSSGKIGR